MLLAARDEEGNPMSAQQLRDEVITLFVAGHETTANALAWAFYGSDPEKGELRLHRMLGPLLRFLQQKWYLDHFWAWALSHLVYFDSKLISRFDEQAVDGAVYGTGKATYRSGLLLRSEQTGQLQRYALMLATGFLVLIFALGAIEPQFTWSFWQPIRWMQEGTLKP